jgi:protein CpxP
MEDVIAQVKSDRLDQSKLTQLFERHQADRPA